MFPEARHQRPSRALPERVNSARTLEIGARRLFQNRFQRSMIESLARRVVDLTVVGMSSVDVPCAEFSGALQAALTMEEVGAAFLTGIKDVIPADAVGLYRFDTPAGDVAEVSSDAEGQFLQDYEDFGRTDDPVLDFVLQHHRAVDSSRLGTPKWERSGACAALGEAGLVHSMEAPLVVTGMLLGTVNFAREHGAHSFTHQDLLRARVVSEQLALATERALRYEAAGHRSSMFESALDRLPQAVIVTDLDAQVLFRNRAARNDPDLFGGEGLRHGINIEGHIADAMEEFRAHGKRVHIASVRPDDGSQRIVKSYRLGDTQAAAVTMVFDCGGGQADPRQLPAWDVLSRREQEIAQLVSEGLTTKQIADRAFISENTVKQHLKRVFAKTDVRNRAELVQMIWAAAGRNDAASAG